MLVDKPRGWTSNDVCQFVKKRFRFKKVGHGGTLDPFATGLLVLYLNKATRFSSAGLNDKKEYEGLIHFGVETSTGDSEGEIINSAGICDSIKEDQIESVLESLIGPGLQIPPMLSAIKRKGVPLYRLARKGIEVDREARPIEIFDLKMLEWNSPYLKFHSYVSKGTYLRVLAQDIGLKLGVLSSLKELRRVSSGSHHLKNSITIEQLKKLSMPDEISTYLSEMPAYQ